MVDCERWGLARLHIFEEAATRADKREAFQEELGKIAKIRHDGISRLVSWGRDGEELFYADEMLDGEPMPDYLQRTGGLPFSVAAEWVLFLAEMLEEVADGIPFLERFSTLNFQVILDEGNRVRPLFSEFSAWTKPGEQVQEHAREWRLAQIFCSLMAGVPVREFYDRSLPRNFDELESNVQAAVLDALADGRPGAYDSFCEQMRALAQGHEEEQDLVDFPKMIVREWLRRELADSDRTGAYFELSESVLPEVDRYAALAEIGGKECLVQVLPGPESIPRQEWLEQHHSATRRVGKSEQQKVNVTLIEDREGITLVGEERVDGVDLASLVREIDGFSDETAIRMVARILDAVNALESRVGASGIWWLPPENVLLLTGTRSVAGALRYLERKGAAYWREVPVKLRLHQTTSTLQRGVNLPGCLRALTRVPGKQFRDTRRSAVALPLLFYCLTGKRFRWRMPVGVQCPDSGPLAELMEETRAALLERPEENEACFLSSLERLLSARLRGEESAGTEGEGESLTAEQLEQVREILDKTLYQKEITVGEPTVPAKAVADAGRSEAEGEPGGSESLEWEES